MSLYARMQALQNGLFGTLFVMQKVCTRPRELLAARRDSRPERPQKHDNSPPATITGIVIKFLQMSSFLFVGHKCVLVLPVPVQVLTRPPTSPRARAAVFIGTRPPSFPTRSSPISSAPWAGSRS